LSFLIRRKEAAVPVDTKIEILFTNFKELKVEQL
jgi:hypothetical protein